MYKLYTCSHSLRYLCQAQCQHYSRGKSKRDQFNKDSLSQKAGNSPLELKGCHLCYHDIRKQTSSVLLQQSEIMDPLEPFISLAVFVACCVKVSSSKLCWLGACDVYAYRKNWLSQNMWWHMIVTNK